MNNKNVNKDLIYLQDKIMQDFETSEAIKTLRTNIIFSGEENRSVGITSFCEGEGKTTISMNLAASLAMAGKKTIMVDTDMRRSILVKYSNSTQKVNGLGQYLIDECSLNQAIYETDIPGMDILFSGTRVANPAELLGGKKFQNMIETLKKEYQYVVVDTPPLGRVIDCAIMSPVIDGLLIVVNAEKNNYRDVLLVKQQYEKTKGTILGVVINKQKSNHGGHYYRGSYRYGLDSKN